MQVAQIPEPGRAKHARHVGRGLDEGSEAVASDDRVAGGLGARKAPLASGVPLGHPRCPSGDRGCGVQQVDKLCATCHETYYKAFLNNIHRDQGCDSCHGASSRHLESQGKEPRSIISLKKRDDVSEAGRPTTPAERNEVCLRCHESEPHAPGTTWRTSVHAHNNVACTDCHMVHYNVPPGTPATVVARDDSDTDSATGSLANFSRAAQLSSRFAANRTISPPSHPTICYRCHAELKRLEQVDHPHQIGRRQQLQLHDLPRRPRECTAPRPAGTHCLKCHNGPHMNEWHGSPHDLAGIGCTDCHNPHPESGLPMSVDQPNVCYRCHSETRELEEIAHCASSSRTERLQLRYVPPPARTGDVGDAVGSSVCNATRAPRRWRGTRRSTSGKVSPARTATRPTRGRTYRGWSTSATHRSAARSECRCRSTSPARAIRCHPKIFALTSMPSHHPIREGKMVCSDCHDGHGQAKGNLKTETVNDALLRVSRGEARAVRLGARAGDRELRLLSQSTRDGGQQPIAPADNVPLPALPHGPLDARRLAAVCTMPLCKRRISTTSQADRSTQPFPRHPRHDRRCLPIARSVTNRFMEVIFRPGLNADME